MLRFQASRHQCLLPPVPSTSAAAVPTSSSTPGFAHPGRPNWRCLPISMHAESIWRGRSGSPFFRGKASMSSGRERMGGEGERWNEHGEFLQASVLVPETVRHYNLLRRGFLEETKWHTSGQVRPLLVQPKGPNASPSSFGYGFLRRFQSPTIFLKIACDVDLLLPIVVGEFAIERFLESLTSNNNNMKLHADSKMIQGCPSQFQFMKNLVGVLGHEVKMVQITKRVINTYYASIVLCKHTEMAYLNVDSRPSDAIIVANTFKVPIYVSKDIVFQDAIKIVSGTWRKSGSKTVYDVLLDSAIEGHDFLSEEFNFLQKMNVAVNEERYNDAALWRDKLTRLRLRKQDP